MDSFVFFPYIYTGSGSTCTPVAITREFARHGHHARMYVASLRERLPAGLDYRTWLPVWVPRQLRGGRFHRLACRAVAERLIAEVRRSGPGTPVWLWPGADVATLARLKDAGALIIREMINTHQGTARRILDAEAARLGVAPFHEITDASIAAECGELALADLLVSSNEQVDLSLGEWGVEPDRILRSFFGWDPSRFPDLPARMHRRAEDAPFTVLFVGEISYRKGAHLALAAWERAGIPGELRLVGRVTRELEALVARHVATGRVRHVGFTPDVAEHYLSSDLFFFPTLEEGGPIVTCEAMACGLPVLTGPMGVSRLVEHGASGSIVDPHDEDGMVEALRRFAADRAQTREMGRAAARAAAAHRWEDAAASRLGHLSRWQEGHAPGVRRLAPFQTAATGLTEPA